MTTLSFTDPRVVAAYIDRFEDRSIAPIVPYLWENTNTDSPIISKVRREELDMMVIDSDKDELRVDAAVYTDHVQPENGNSVLVISHDQYPDSDNYWDTKVLIVLPSRVTANNLAKMIAGEAAVAFSVVE